MITIIVIVLTVAVTLSAITFGYWLARIQRNLENISWFQEMTIDDLLSDTPIANKLDRDYGFDN
jgi:uncharacterized membrane protein